MLSTGQGRGYGVSNFLEEWAPRVYRFALRLSNDPHVAEDLAQETFLRAWRNRECLRDERAARVWLFRITANLWRDQLRRNRSPVARANTLRFHCQVDAIDRSFVPVERLLVGREELQRALEMLNDLPARQKEVLYLNACEGMSSREIAGVLGITREAVKASLSLARKRMRELLGDLLPDPTAIERD
jgi:RNA polymerase sigma-70 factor (ECF subfamily)